MMPGEWHDWHDFYMLLGTASAALVAKVRVATLRSGVRKLAPIEAATNNSALLLISLIAMVPSHTALSLALGITLVAVAGLGYTTVVLVGLARAFVSEIIGGMTQTTVKKENGARLLTPLLLNVDAQPIGRGTTAPVSKRYTCRFSTIAGSNSR